jgi:uncharacterized membrane protein
MNKTWKVVLTFTCVFLAGAVAGGFTYARFARTVVESRIRAEQFASSYLKRLEESLELTPEQVVRIKPVIEATGEELGRMRRETIGAFQRLDAAIVKELTPEQKTKFEEMQRRMRERRDRDRDRDRDRERSPDGPPTPPSK